MISLKQILLIALALVLGLLLYFAPKKGSDKAQEPEHSHEGGQGEFSEQFEAAKKDLTAEQQEIFSRLEEKRTQAEKENSEAAWQASATEFLKAARYFQDQRKAVMYQGAIQGFEKAIARNPGNLAAKTSLGSAMVEGSHLLGLQPMKGITILREVLASDSLNIEANLQLGLFSVTSRQFDKAVDRFKRILKIDSTRIDMYVYLGDTYLTMGEKQKAIENYEGYKERVKDTLIIKDINEYIKKLKQQP